MSQIAPGGSSSGEDDDAYEDNDTIGTARTISTGTINNLRCLDTLIVGGNHLASYGDWYKVNASSGQTLTVTTSFTHANGDLDLQVYNPSQVLAGSSEGSVNSESVAVSSTSSGYYYIFVYGYNGAKNQNYSLSVSLVNPTASITVTANPSNGGTVSGGGTYAVGSQQQISASANSGWTFTGWSDGNTSNPRTITVPSGGATYTANFQQQTATITVAANPSNGGTVSGGGTYAVGSQQQISASANSGWTFAGWSDGNTSNPRTITVPSGGATYTANFQQQTATITVAANPSNGGTVSGGGTYTVGSQQQISASANSGWNFTGWNDGNTSNPRNITVPSGGATYTANFSQQTAAISVTANPSNGGTVSGGGTYTVGSQQQISASANSGWTFTGWSDGNTSNPRTITVPSNGASYTASFSQPTQPGTLQFSAATASVAENAGSVTLTVTRTGGSSGAVGVSFATASGTATAGSDFTAASGTLSWANGDTASKTITVSILTDLVTESSETFTISLSSPTGGATLGGIASVTVTIIDTSSPAGGLVANYSFENSGVDASANRNDATATGGTYGAGAIGSAFVSGSGAYLTAPDSPSLRITGHAISIAAWVNPTQFSGSGNRRTILRKMSQSGGSGGYLFSLDNNGHPQFGFQSGVTYYEQTATTWALPLNQWTHLAVTYDGAMVRFYTNGMPAPAIAQTGGLTADSPSLAIGRLSSADASEEFVGKLDEVQLYSSLLSFSEVQSLFALGRGTIQFSSASYTVTEGAGQISLTVTRLGGSAGAVGVDFSTANGSAIAGQDYTATNGTLNWGDGDMAAKTITVSILNDSVAESSENFAVRLFSPTGGANLGSDTNAIVTILDDDNAPPAGTFQISFVTVNGAQSNPVFDLDGTTRLGSSYYGQLYVGTTAQSLSAIGGPVAFLDGAGAGFIVAGTVTGSGIAGLYGGATGVYQLRVWNSSAGSTFEAAAASGSGRFGLSQIISTTFGGTDPLGGPPRIPPDANLHSSFSVALGTPPPSITSQPVGGTTSPGTNFTLSVSASGWGALTYQWWRNGSPLADGPRVSGALTRNLTILNARRSDSGKYSVIVANAGGSVTSSNATVRILAQSALERPWRNAAGNLVIGIRDSESGLLTTADMPTLELQFSTNFTNWVTVTNAMVLTNGQFQVEVSPTAARGFYRVIER